MSCGHLNNVVILFLRVPYYDYGIAILYLRLLYYEYGIAYPENLAPIIRLENVGVWNNAKPQRPYLLGVELPLSKWIAVP